MQEIADELGLSKMTVSQHFEYAKKKIFKYIMKNTLQNGSIAV